MTQDEADRLARSRYVAITVARAAGTVIMLLGLWIWLGDILRQGGWPLVGVPLFVVGFVESLILPRLLIRRWRSPRP
ncbi:MAG: hypothetical protein PGN09_01650 [Sphingomonas fennica]